ncbi:hypothetical protein AB1Y20_020743 [Prymnesium parvum]|uniref:Uncharacterized protein n=1 Tax=Prymnesium parvum TaxID=97485 RepID=A0AB34JYZ1_PRYPA
MSNLVETLGSIAIFSAASACAAIAHLRSSPLALLTLCACALVMCPFALLASLLLCCGACCCLPILLLGLAAAWAPSLARLVVSSLHPHVYAAAAALGLPRVSAVLQAHPNLTVLGCLMLLPAILTTLAVASAVYLFCLPVSLPLTLYLFLRHPSSPSPHPRGPLLSPSPAPSPAPTRLPSEADWRVHAAPRSERSAASVRLSRQPSPPRSPSKPAPPSPPSSCASLAPSPQYMDSIKRLEELLCASDAAYLTPDARACAHQILSREAHLRSRVPSAA